MICGLHGIEWLGLCCKDKHEVTALLYNGETIKVFIFSTKVVYNEAVYHDPEHK